LKIGALVIDPAGFSDPPKDPLKGIELMSAPASPPFYASTLDAVRPVVNAASLRVRPVVEGVTLEAAEILPPPRPKPAAAAPAPAPLVIVTPAPSQPASDPEVVVVPVPVPAGIAYIDRLASVRDAAKPVAPSAHTSPPTALASGRTDRLGARASGAANRKKFRAGESALVDSIVQNLHARTFRKAIEDLDAWTDRYHDTDYSDDRAYYYMLAYNGLNQPIKVLDVGVPLLARPVTAVFEDPMQQLSVVYLTAVSYQNVARPTREQNAAARTAARAMLEILPSCFTPERRPTVMSAADWAKSRTDLETLARQTIARARS
jgi:hypothetical protein